MKILAIANISNGKKTIGFRLMDIESKQVKDAPIESIKQVLQSNKATIDNLRLENNTIVGSNGSINRLPKLINGQLIGKSPLIILNQLDNTEYTVSDFKGAILKIKTKDVINYAKTRGISNAKLVTKDNKEFISSINGTYEKRLEQSEENKIEVVNAKLAVLNLPYRINKDGSMKLLERDIEEITIYKPVIRITDNLLSGNRKLKRVIIQADIIEIGGHAFKNCESIESIKLPNSILTIAEYAFSGCKSLKTITIPKNVTSIGEYAFGWCESIASAIIPNSLEIIAEFAFSECRSLASIVIPNSVTVIAEYAFSGCKSLESITIPNSVTSIEEFAFSWCAAIKSVNIPNSVTSIGKSAFYNCSSLKSITIPKQFKNNVRDIFEACISLKDINFV